MSAPTLSAPAPTTIAAARRMLAGHGFRFLSDRVPGQPVSLTGEYAPALGSGRLPLPRGVQVVLEDDPADGCGEDYHVAVLSGGVTVRSDVFTDPAAAAAAAVSWSWSESAV